MFRSECYVVGKAGVCVLESTVEGNDLRHECTCAGSPNVYTFYRNMELDVNFKYMGYPYTPLVYSTAPAAREIDLFNKLEDDTITIVLSATVTFCNLGTTPGTFVPATAICTVGADDYHLWDTEYKYDLTDWKSMTELWLIDHIAMVCYKRGSCNKYQLVYDIADDTYNCNYGTL